MLSSFCFLRWYDFALVLIHEDDVYQSKDFQWVILKPPCLLNFHISDFFLYTFIHIYI